MSAPKLRLVLSRAAVFLDLDHPLDPGVWGLVSSYYDQDNSQRFRVTAARVTAVFPQSRLGGLLRKIPGVARLLRDRDAKERARAAEKLRIDYVAIGNFQATPDKCDELPTASAGSQISVRVTNTGDRPLCARIAVEGVLS